MLRLQICVDDPRLKKYVHLSRPGNSHFEVVTQLTSPLFRCPSRPTCLLPSFRSTRSTRAGKSEGAMLPTASRRIHALYNIRSAARLCRILLHIAQIHRLVPQDAHPCARWQLQVFLGIFRPLTNHMHKSTVHAPLQLSVRQVWKQQALSCLVRNSPRPACVLICTGRDHEHQYSLSHWHAFKLNRCHTFLSVRACNLC